MKLLKLSLFIFLGLVCANLQAQDKSSRPSPPKSSSAVVNDAQITIDYSSPGVKGRTIWGDLVPYNQVWRTGANEATTFTTDKDIAIAGKQLKAGKYSLFTIPAENEWTIILNDVWDQWGDYNYEASKDVMRFSAKPYALEEPEERLSIEVNKDGRVTIKWDRVGVSFSIQ